MSKCTTKSALITKTNETDGVMDLFAIGFDDHVDPVV